MASRKRKLPFDHKVFLAKINGRETKTEYQVAVMWDEAQIKTPALWTPGFV